MIYRKKPKKGEKDDSENQFRFKSLMIQNDKIMNEKSEDQNITDRLIQVKEKTKIFSQNNLKNKNNLRISIDPSSQIRNTATKE